jgi:hypothetical protein
MIDLGQRSEPYEIALPYGLAVTVKPLTTAGMAAAQASARRAVEAIERQARERTEAGLAPDGLPDLSAEGERDGFYQAQLIRELAVRHITGWTGVELGGGPAPPRSWSSTRWASASSRSSRCAKYSSTQQKTPLGPLPLASPAERRARILSSLPRRRPSLRPRRARIRRTALSLPRARLDQPPGA